jgi:hypothetical protein
MSLLEANDVGVISGEIHMPLNGAWTADLVIDQSDPSGFDAGTSVTLKSDNGFSLVGTVMPDRSGSFIDAVHVRLVGGKAGMGKTVKPRGFVQPGSYVRDVLNGFASDSGETLSTNIDSGFLTTNLVAWTTQQSTTAQALNALLAIVAPTADWRFLADGKLWVGVETWPASSDAFDILSQDPTSKTFDLGIDAPSILPGVTLDGVGRVARVVHYVDGDSDVRSHVWADAAAEEQGIAGSVATIVKQQLSGMALLGLYECKVISQSGDLSTVDVQMLAPFDGKFPGQQRVEVRAGTGVKIQFTPGAKVLLGWKGGDARYPYVALGLGADGFLAWSLGSSPDAVVTKQDITAIFAAISGAPVAPMDGGATFKAALIAAWPPLVGSTSVKVQR